MPERKVASIGDRTNNHKVMSSTRSPLSHPVGACWLTGMENCATLNVNGYSNWKDTCGSFRKHESSLS